MKNILFATLLVFAFANPQAEATLQSKVLTAGNPTNVFLLDSGVATTFNLPQGALAVGRIYEFKKTDNNFTAITITPYGSETIDGASSTTVNTKGETLRIISDGVKWEVLSRSSNTQWTSFTPTITTATGTMSNYTSAGKWRRIGDSIEIEGLITYSSTPGSFSGPMSELPSGLSADGSKLTSTDLDRVLVGTMKALNAGTIHYVTGSVYYRSSTSVYLQPPGVSTHTGLAPVEGRVLDQTFPFAFDSGDSISYNFKMPISGWK